MDDQTFRNKKAAKDQEDYKDFEKVSYFYWGMLILLVFGTWNQLGQTFGIISALLLFGFSIPLKSRIVMYYIVSLVPLTLGAIYAGWSGVIGGGLLSIFFALICYANYYHASTVRYLEVFDENSNIEPANTRMDRRRRI